MEEAEAGVSAADIQNRIQMPGVVRVYVSPVCPHCPGALGRWLYMAAWAPDRVDLHVIDAAVFSESAARDNVKSVPTAILDDQFRWTGVVAVAELLDIFEKRNPADLSADTVKKIISDGDAEGLAALMAGANSVIPGFLDLLAHPKWPTRLGAMVAFEYLAETAPDLARQALEAMWNRFTALDDAVKGDMIHLFGVLNDSEFAGGRFLLFLFLPAAQFLDDLLGNLGRDLVVVGKLHGKHPAAAGHGAKIRRIGEHLGLGYQGAHHLVFAPAFHAQHPAAPGV
jgi:hypothetical protein